MTSDIRAAAQAEAANALREYSDLRTIVIGPVSGDGLARMKQLTDQEDE